MSTHCLRIAAIGDLHCTRASEGTFQPLFGKVGESADVLVLCGDLTDYGTPEEARVLAKELGATHGVNAKADDPVKQIRALTGGGVDYSFECIGLKLAAEQCFDCIKHGGTATVVGMIPVGQKIELDGPIFLREKKIQGCSMGSNRFKVDMPRYIELYRQGRLMLDEMITRRGRLEDVNEAFRAMKAGEVSRTVLMLD
jgi:S-(hydroxymethyl)glutathione dehydrogenase/alcohol dehydrogenase